VNGRVLKIRGTYWKALQCINYIHTSPFIVS